MEWLKNIDTKKAITTVIYLAIAVFVILVLVNGFKWLQDLMGFGSGDKKQNKGNGRVDEMNWGDLLDGAGVVDGITDDFNPQAIVKDLYNVNEEWYFMDASPRCQAYKRAYEKLTEKELAAVAVAYEKAYEKRLKSHIEDTNWGGCSISNDYKKLLLNRLAQLNV